MKRLSLDRTLDNADWLKREWTYPTTLTALRNHLKLNRIRVEDFRERPIVALYRDQPGFEWLKDL